MSKRDIILYTIAGLLVLGGLAAWFWHQNAFSPQAMLQFGIEGPATATAGDEITYTVRYKNTSNFTLQNAKLSFSMPDYSLTEDSRTLINQDLKDIYPGDEETVLIKARLLGQEGDQKVARASISYSPENLTARYESDATFSTTIATMPITMNFDLPDSAPRVQSLQFAINYASDFNYPLEQLSIKVAPVSGFTVTASQPKSLDNVEWKIPTLNKGQSGKVSITGNLDANAADKLTFAADLGVWQNGNFVVVKHISQDLPTTAPVISAAEQSCTSSGGTVTQTTCFCASTQDFYNTCVVGACTCNPAGGASRQVKSCDCGPGKCFDGNSCITPQVQVSL